MIENAKLVYWLFGGGQIINPPEKFYEDIDYSETVFKSVWLFLISLVVLSLSSGSLNEYKVFLTCFHSIFLN
jgi:hypothetical protein